MRRVVGSDSRRAEDVRVRANLGGQIMIRANQDQPVPARDELTPNFFVLRLSYRCVVNGAITKDANIRVLEEVRNPARFRNRLLGLIRQTIVSISQGAQKPPLKLGP